MRIVFLSDQLPVDRGMLPLWELLDFTDRNAPNAIERMRATTAKAGEWARKPEKPTFFLQMPENVLQYWREMQEKHNEQLSAKRHMQNLLMIDHVEWRKLYIAVPEAIPFFLSKITVQASNFSRDILNREDHPVTGKPIYRPPVYNDDIHGA